MRGASHRSLVKRKRRDRKISRKLAKFRIEMERISALGYALNVTMEQATRAFDAFSEIWQRALPSFPVVVTYSANGDESQCSPTGGRVQPPPR